MNGKLIIDPKQKADALNSQFKSVFTEETDFQISSKRLAPKMTDIIISTPGVSNLLRGIDTSNAIGPDNFSPRVLKELADVLAEPIASIYKKLLEQEQVPNDWLNARVAPTYKKGQSNMSIMQAFGTYRHQSYHGTLANQQYTLSFAAWFPK